MQGGCARRWPPTCGCASAGGPALLRVMLRRTAPLPLPAPPRGASLLGYAAARGGLWLLFLGCGGPWFSSPPPTTASLSQCIHASALFPAVAVAPCQRALQANMLPSLPLRACSPFLPVYRAPLYRAHLYRAPLYRTPHVRLHPATLPVLHPANSAGRPTCPSPQSGAPNARAATVPRCCTLPICARPTCPSATTDARPLAVVGFN